MRIQRNSPLAPYTTLKVGGPAEALAAVSTASEMGEALRWARERGLPHLVLGKGSNILFADEGFPGLVIVSEITHLEQQGPRFRVGAGYPFTRLGIQTARLGYTGLEFASGIPGSVGGAVYMNAGAAGQETADTLELVEVLTSGGESRHYRREELVFSYRTSPFQNRDEAIVSATFCLREEGGARERQREYLIRRQKSQPLTECSAGCFFRNPEGTSAGALIDRCGLKGLSEGPIAISDLHANFLVNRGGGTAAQVRSLSARIKGEVKRQTGVDLHEEVRYISG
ncbi:MAG: UDP-N-acetylmuramate dehydrogenase [Parachlamydiales bacterium]